jgi:hypothetical protein
MTHEERAANPELQELRQEVKDNPNKDRKTEIVFIGQHLDKEEIITKCELTLLTNDEETKLFLTYEDPFEVYMEISE